MTSTTTVFYLLTSSVLIYCLSVGVIAAPVSEDCEGVKNPRDLDPCQVCECAGDHYECERVDMCQPLRCVDGVKNDGDCCAHCPNGENCEKDGVIISKNSQVFIPGYGACICVSSSNWGDGLTAFCLQEETPPNLTSMDETTAVY
ncbi:kielin/chordin-like protein [Physella acuta]|uniref:kielin/chordin-like protein n=1 Tax=Physella acuta TaxID=109671 RepID=UPI0027DD7BF4|nr:kielin/chordin-like protein [Physella acuta]